MAPMEWLQKHLANEVAFNDFYNQIQLDPAKLVTAANNSPAEIVAITLPSPYFQPLLPIAQPQ
jgi:hypothetical protein